MTFKSVVKGLVVAVTSAVAIPYTVAIICNVLYGWPKKNKFQRAFNPVKVYSLNYTVLQRLMRIKYLGLYLKWKRFYRNAKATRIIKDITYGCNDNALDIYFPKLPKDGSSSKPLPVVVFVYGGSWSSGDKNMYGLLCTQLADTLKALVCCINYSIYPQGYVDDMVQDVVDCLGWLQANISQYGGDKNQVMLLGHSAGAHLCMMSVLELSLKQMIHDPTLLMSHTAMTSTTQAESFHFEESHFNGSSEEEEEEEKEQTTLLSESQTAPMAFYIQSGGNSNGEAGNGNLGIARSSEPSLQSSASSDILMASRDSSFFVVQKQEEDSKAEEEQVQVNEGDEKQESEYLEKTVLEIPEKKVSVDSEVTLKPSDEQEMTESDSGAGTSHEGQSAQPAGAQDKEIMTKSQREVRDMLTSVKAVIGLAGVYDIADHYEHEASRGIEDVSYMHRAMYDPEHFSRFSPTLIIRNLPAGIGLPYIHLIHGNRDKIVPVSSTTKLAEALKTTSTDVTVKIIADCSHEDICLNLMTVKEKHYYTVMDSITKTASKVFQ